MDPLKNISMGRNAETSMGLRWEFNVKHKFKRHIKEETTERVWAGAFITSVRGKEQPQIYIDDVTMVSGDRD
jgi:hypothetical protein